MTDPRCSMCSQTMPRYWKLCVDCGPRVGSWLCRSLFGYYKCGPTDRNPDGRDHDQCGWVVAGLAALEAE